MNLIWFIEIDVTVDGIVRYSSTTVSTNNKEKERKIDILALSVIDIPIRTKKEEKK
jgi:hypothetical protein